MLTCSVRELATYHRVRLNAAKFIQLVDGEETELFVGSDDYGRDLKPKTELFRHEPAVQVN